MDNKLTEKIKVWLEATEQERDYMAGALMVLRLSGNKIMYRNMTANIDAHHADVEYQLQKYYNFRVAELTHVQVVDMSVKVEVIAKEHELEGEPEEKFAAGKRADHDSLPQEIKECYTDNLPILRQMRELHMQLRHLSTEDSTCPDSERYPFLTELIALDKKMHANWERYDTYVAPKRRTAKTSKAKSK